MNRKQIAGLAAGLCFGQAAIAAGITGGTAAVLAQTAPVTTFKAGYFTCEPYLQDQYRPLSTMDKTDQANDLACERWNVQQAMSNAEDDNAVCHTVNNGLDFTCDNRR